MQVKLPLQNPATNSKQFILIDAFDQIHENPLHLSIHRLVVSRIMGSNRTIISDINFNKLPQQNFLNGTDIYMTDKLLLDNDEYLPGDTNDLASRSFLYRIPLINQEKLAPDNYHFEIQVWDISGNKTSKFVHL